MMAAKSASSSASGGRRRTHAICGDLERISLHTSTPLPSGSRTYRTATSGHVGGILAKASATVAASPATTMSSVLSINDRSPHGPLRDGQKEHAKLTGSQDLANGLHHEAGRRIADKTSGNLGRRPEPATHDICLYFTRNFGTDVRLTIGSCARECSRRVGGQALPLDRLPAISLTPLVKSGFTRAGGVPVQRCRPAEHGPLDPTHPGSPPRQWTHAHLHLGVQKLERYATPLSERSRGLSGGRP